MNFDNFKKDVYEKMYRGDYTYNDYMEIGKILKRFCSDDPKTTEEEVVVETKKNSILPYAIGAVVGLGLLLV